MKKDDINLQNVYARIYLKEDENFKDQINPSALERAEGVYGQETPSIEANPDVATFDTHDIKKIYNAVKGGMSLQDFEYWVKSVQTSEVDDMPQTESTQEIPPVEGEEEDWGEGSNDSLPPTSHSSNDSDDELNEKKEKFTINTPTQGQLISKTRAPVHKPTMQIKPKKGIYNRQQFKKDYE
jgi:hypothetical protein